MKDMVEPASVQDEGIQLQWRPRYLNGTISSCAADSSEQAEVERLSNTFCSGSHWTLGKLPTHFEPGSIQTARKASTMTNLLGAGMTNSPDRLAYRAFHGATPNSYFSASEYITTDYNKNDDLHKALLEDERNLNASHSRKPFKTSAFTRLTTPVPHNFGVRIPSKVSSMSGGNQATDVGDNDVPEREKEALQRTAIKRKILDLKLGQLVRNEYEIQEKEKFLSGHFCYQNSNISVGGDRIQLRKSAAVMREWSKKLFSDLSADWPNLKFKIMLQNTMENGKVDGNGIDLLTGKKIEEENIHTISAAADNRRVDPSTRGRRNDEGADELLIQFETDSQNLPPEGALNRYMGHMATRGKAMEFGLRKRSDRWGVLEKGLVQAEVPISAPDRILIRIVEYEVKKLVKSKNTVLSDVGVLSTDKLNESLSSQIAEALTASGFDPLIPVSRDYSGVSTRDHPRTNLAGSMLSIITTSSNDSPERHSPVREISSEEVGEKKNLRLLLYRSMSTTEDYSTLVGRALSKAKVDLQLGTTEGSTEGGGVGCMSARGLIHSARKDSARGYSRGTDSSRAISVSIAAAAALLLSTTIHVKCTTKDVEETSPLDPKNILSSELQEMKKIQPVIEYDFNGHVCSPSSPEEKKSYPRKGIKDIPKENKISGFSSTYEEGGSVTDLFNSLVKSFIAHLTPNPGIPRKSDIDGGRIYTQSTLKTAPTTTSNSTSDMFLGNVQPKVREVNLVIDITGKWLQETVTEVTKMGTGTGTSADNYGNKKMLRPESRNISQDPHDNNSEEEEAGAGAVSPTMSARSAGISASDPVDLPIPIQKPIMSIRKLLRTAREFSTAEKGESYLYSRKMKMMEKERTSKVAIEERNKLDSQTAVFTAKRRKIVLQFTVTSTDDVQALSEKCIAKGAGLPPYQPIESRTRKNSFRVESGATSGYDTPNTVTQSPSIATKKFLPMGKYQEETKPPIAIDDNEIFEIRPDGMRETNLFTFSFCAPWLKVSQMHASKKEANDFRLKAREIQRENTRKKALWRHNAEKLLFGEAVDPRLISLTLQAGGGLEGMKWLLADIGDKNGLMQTSDVLTEMPLTARKNALVGNTSFLNSGSSSHRQSTNIMFTANDKNVNSARLSSATTRAPSFSNAAIVSAGTNYAGLSAGKTSTLQPKTGSKVAIGPPGSSSSSSSNMNSAQSSAVHRLDPKGLTESRRSFLKPGGDGSDFTHMRNGSMQSIMTDTSDHDSNPEIKYRAIRHLKLVAYDDANVLMGRNSLQNRANDADFSPLDTDEWSQKDTKSSWTPLPGQNLNRWSRTM